MEGEPGIAPLSFFIVSTLILKEYISGMAKERLVVHDYRDKFYIAWYFPEDEDVGATLGEDLSTIDDPDVDQDHFIATKYLMSIECERDTYGFYWETKSGAQKALREIKAQINLKMGNKEMPDWAKKALEAGWKPPKNWKP